jgi:hypothetical protein
MPLVSFLTDFFLNNLNKNKVSSNKQQLSDIELLEGAIKGRADNNNSVLLNE